MNWWLKVSNLRSHVQNSATDIGSQIKDQIKAKKFFHKLFAIHGIPMDALDSLKITVQPLKDEYAKAGEDEVIVGKELVDSGKLFGPKFHFVTHEILHWLKRQVEKNDYFADPEEIESFSTAIAYSIYENRKKKGLYKALKQEFLPLVMVSIKDQVEADKFLKARINDAKQLLRDMKLCNFSS